MIEMKCPHCRKTLIIPAQYAGQSGKCNGCGGQIIVPGGRKVAPLTQAVANQPPQTQQSTQTAEGQDASKLTMAQQLVRFVLLILFIVAAQLLNASAINLLTYRLLNSLAYLALGVAVFWSVCPCHTTAGR